MKKDTRIERRLIRNLILINFFIFLLGSNFSASFILAQENLVVTGGSFAKVEGDWKRFREDNWMDRNLTSGLEEFRLDKYFEGGRHLILETNGTSDHDYDFALDFSKEEFGYLRLNYDNFRKYYDDSGDYFLFANPRTDPPWYKLDKNIHADRSVASIELALTLPEQPKYFLGYERRERYGEALLLTRGMVTDTAPAPDLGKFIYPWSKDINWAMDTFKVGTELAIKGINIAVNQQYQKFSDDEYSDNVNEVRDNNFSAVRQRIKTQDEPSYHSAITNFLADSQVGEKLNLKLGYCLTNTKTKTQYYSQVYGSNPGTVATTATYSGGEANGDVAAQAASYGMNFKLMDNLILKGALRYRMADSSTSSKYRKNTTSPNSNVWHSQHSDVGESTCGESVSLAYKGIPRTTIYAEGTGEQSQVDYREFGREYDYANSTNLNRDSQAYYRKENYACGINTRPIKPLFISAYYKRKTKDNNYKDNNYDTREQTQNSGYFFEYPGYIGENTRLTDEYGLRANITPFKFISFSLKYQEAHTAYNVIKEPYEEIASLDSRSGSAGITFTPNDKLYLNGLYSLERTLLKTPAADVVVRSDRGRTEAYLNDSHSVLGSVNYALNDKTALSGQYQDWLSETDTSSKSAYIGLERKLIENILLKVGYSYYLYSEDHPNADVNDYKAHVGSVSLTGKF